MTDTNLYAAFDPSAKKIAVAAVHPLTNTHVTKAWNLYARGQTKQSNESIARADAAMDDVIRILDAMGSGDRFAWVEAPLVGASVTSTLKQAYIGGIIRARMVRAGWTVYDVNVSTWKKVVCGTGRAEKAQVQQMVGAKWPKAAQTAGSDGDILDAAAMVLYGQEVVRKASALAGPAGTAPRAVPRGRP